MRVALVGPYPDDPERIVGGVTAVMLSLARCLAADPMLDIHVITTTKLGESDRTLSKDGLTVHYRRESRHRAIPRLLSNVGRIRRAIRSVSPDIVHGQSPVGSVAGIKNGMTTVHTIHGLPFAEVRLAKTAFRALALRLEGHLARRAVSGADHVVATSDYGLRQFAAPRGRVHKIANPVEDDFFGIEDRDEGHKLLYAGGIRVVKNTLGLIRAFDRILQQRGDAELIVCGKGSEREYEAQVGGYLESRELRDSVRIMGLVSQDELIKQFSTCSAVCLFSEQEGSPTLIAQAMCAGKPVVASRAGGIPELVSEGETGFTVDCGDEASFAARAIELLNAPSLRRSMGARAREIAEHRFRKEVVAEQTKSVYAQALTCK